MLKGVICKFPPRTLKSENISELFVCVAVLSAQSRGVNLCRTEDILCRRKDSGKVLETKSLKADNKSERPDHAALTKVVSVLPRLPPNNYNREEK